MPTARQENGATAFTRIVSLAYVYFLDLASRELHFSFIFIKIIFICPSRLLSTDCGSIPQRTYINPVQSTVWARCGLTEVDARTFCGEPCTWQCSNPDETCYVSYMWSICFCSHEFIFSKCDKIILLGHSLKLLRIRLYRTSRIIVENCFCSRLVCLK